MDFSTVSIIGFDLDQTLYPKSPLIDTAIQKYLDQHIADRLGISREHAQERFQSHYRYGEGISGRKTLIRLGFSEEEAGALVQEALERADIDVFLIPDPTTIAFLNRCARRFESVDVITGSFRSNAERKLERLGIPMALFRHVIAGDDASKSDGAAYQMWLSMYAKKAPEHFLYVGDRPTSDHDVPKRFGIRSVLVNITHASADCPQYASIAEFDRALFSPR
jgi:FMN phosphatase YigB (HAD superfamily)